jgi:hypothetical protein
VFFVWRDHAFSFLRLAACKENVEAERAGLALCLPRLLFNPSRIFDYSAEIGLRSIGLASQRIPGELAASA